jgi:hypothetical protein
MSSPKSPNLLEPLLKITLAVSLTVVKFVIVKLVIVAFSNCDEPENTPVGNNRVTCVLPLTIPLPFVSYELVAEFKDVILLLAVKEFRDVIALDAVKLLMFVIEMSTLALLLSKFETLGEKDAVTELMLEIDEFTLADVVSKFDKRDA